jgi:hypothetical protein
MVLRQMRINLQAEVEIPSNQARVIARQIKIHSQLFGVLQGYQKLLLYAGRHK